jgi:hypothetical protein
VNAYHAASGFVGVLNSNRTVGDAPYDILEVAMADFGVQGLWTGGLVIPVNDPSIAHIIRPDENPWGASAFTIVGDVQWGVHFKPINTTGILSDVLVFNNTLRERFGLPCFYDMVRNGEWTWDAFDSIVNEVVSVSNGNVMPIIFAHEMAIMPAFIASNDGLLAQHTPQGLRFVGHSNDNALAAMNFVYDLAGRNVFHPFSPRGGHNSHGHIGTAMGAGDAMFAFSWYSLIKNLTNGVPGYETVYTFGILPTPMGPNAAGFGTVVHNEILYKILADIQRPEEAAAILVAIANRTSQPREELIAHELMHSLQSVESAEMLEIMLSNVRVDVSRIHGGSRSAGGNAMVAASLRILQTAQTPVAAMQQIADQMQIWFDELAVIGSAD